MGRLIDEDEVLKALCRELCHPGAICPDGYCEEIRERLNDVPTVHPEPPKIGKWIAVDSFSAFGGDEVTWEAHGNPVAYYYCSVCKEQCRVDEFGEFILSNYCPDCGAKMEA